MADPLQIALSPSATVSADGSSTPVDIGADGLHTLLRGSVSVLSISNLDPSSNVELKIESSPDGANGWMEAIVFGFRTAVVEEFTIDGLQRYCRMSWSLAGATVTFSASAESHVLYATRRDLNKKSLPSEITDEEDRDLVAEALLDATGDADDALRIQYPGPLATWPDSLRKRCADIARYCIMERIGFQPGGVDELLVKAYDDAQGWLRAVAARKIVLSGVSSPALVEPTRVSLSPDNQDPPPRFSDDWGDFG